MDNLSSYGLRCLKREQECRAQPSKISNQCNRSTTNKVGVVFRSLSLDIPPYFESKESDNRERGQSSPNIPITRKEESDSNGPPSYCLDVALVIHRQLSLKAKQLDRGGYLNDG